MTKIALVVLDTLRKDAFDEYFDWLPGKRFENAWAPSHWTVPVHASLFTGYYPSEINASVKSQSLNCDESTLAETLSEQGYTTRAFSANPKVSRRFQFDRGFETFAGSWRTKTFNKDIFDWQSYKNGGLLSPIKALSHCLKSEKPTVPSLRYRAELILRDRILPPYPDDGAQTAKSWVENNEMADNEFWFFNLMEAHAPYDPPAKYKEYTGPRTPGIGILRTARDDNSELATLREGYDESVQYLSDIYKEIFEELQDQSDYIITVADHGELFGEHGVWEHDYGLYPELTHVPLVVSSGNEKKTTSDELVSLLDVHATVLSLAGVDAESRGDDLTTNTSPTPRIMEYAGLTEYKIERLREAGLADHVDRYDQPLRGIALAPSYYGYQTLSEFVETGVANEEEPQQVLADISSDLPEVGSESSQELSSTARSHLEDLGYI